MLVVKTKGRHWRIFLLSFLLVASLLGVLIFRLPLLVENYVRAELKQLGINDFTLGTPHIALDGARLSWVEVAGESDGLRFSLLASDVLVSYHWRTLLSGQVNSVRIDDVSATLELAADDESEAGFEFTDTLATI